VRNLKPEDLNGTSDPVVYASVCFPALRVCVEVLKLKWVDVCSLLPQVLGKKKHTAVKKQRTSCVFDTVLFFNLDKLDREQIDEAVITVSVYDADVLSKNDLIGLYQFDLRSIYFRPDHEVCCCRCGFCHHVSHLTCPFPTLLQLYNQWVGITDPVNSKDKGLQGYLKLSVTVLGPGDKLKVHDLAKDNAEQEKLEATKGLDALLLMPPSIERAVHFLVCNIYRAEDMPSMDDGHLGVIKARATFRSALGLLCFPALRWRFESRFVWHVSLSCCSLALMRMFELTLPATRSHAPSM